MKNRILLISLAVTLALSMSLVACGGEQLGEIQEELASTQQELADAEFQLTQAEETVITLGEELVSTQQELADAEFQLTQAEETISTLESGLQLVKDTWGEVVSRDVWPDRYEGWYGTLVDNVTATDPTWAQLLDFLLEDKTDQNAYVHDVYECGSFARDVHDNAEKAGIRAAYVRLALPIYMHSVNAFQTTDRGLVFIDCTGTLEPEPGKSYDRIVDLKLGADYPYRFLFPELSETIVSTNIETVDYLCIYW